MRQPTQPERFPTQRPTPPPSASLSKKAGGDGLRETSVRAPANLSIPRRRGVGFAVEKSHERHHLLPSTSALSSPFSILRPQRLFPDKKVPRPRPAPCSRHLLRVPPRKHTSIVCPERLFPDKKCAATATRFLPSSSPPCSAPQAHLHRLPGAFVSIKKGCRGTTIVAARRARVLDTPPVAAVIPVARPGSDVPGAHCRET